MPIYEYRCGACGFQKEFLQKMSDDPLSTCPQCQKESLTKLLSAAGFQLKGSGWYATDFKGGPKPKTDSASEGASEVKSDTKAESSDTKKESASHACGTGACPACT